MKNFVLLMLCITESLMLNAQINVRPEKNKIANYIYRNPNGVHEINLFPDSVRIEFPDHQAVIVLQVKSFNETISTITNLPVTLKYLSDQLKQSVVPNGNTTTSYRADVVYKPGDIKEIIIQERQQARTQLLVQKEKIVQLLPPGWEVFIQSKEMKGYVYVQNLQALERLSTQDFSAVLTKLTDFKTIITNRRPIKARFIIRQGLLEYDDIKFEEPYDQISLSASGGIGVLQNKVYPELTATLGLTFADHFNRKNHRFELAYSSMYFAEKNLEGGYNNTISSFLTLSYSKNFEGQNKRAAWVGIGGGLLVHETANYFNGKTAKFFLISDLGTNKLEIIPEFYLTDDFKKFQFGLKLHYRF
jgi:hypothetical protein